MSRKTILMSVFSILAVFALTAFASAAVLDISALSYPATAQHNTELTVTFNVSYSGSASSIIVSFANSTTNIGSWKTLPSQTVIVNNSVPVAFSAVLSVPKYASGVISAMLDAKSLNTSAEDSKPLTIPIQNSNSISISNIQTLTKTQNGIINVTNNGNTLLTNINLNMSGDIGATLSANNFALNAGGSRAVTVTPATNLSEVEVGTHSITINAQDIPTSASASYTYSITGDYCDKGNVNATKIEIKDIEDKSVNTKNEWEWKPLDDIEIKVKVSNKLDSDEDFVVALGLYDTVDKEFLEIDGEDTLEKDVSIDEDDSETITFEFKAPVELEKSTGRYVLFVKAYVDGDEDAVCNSYAAKNVPGSSVDDINIKRESHDVILDEITLPDVATAGETITISAKAYNIGTDDEPKVKVILSNSKLGLTLESDAFELDSGDSDNVEFSFVVPYSIEDGYYIFKLSTEFYYSKSSDTYKKDSEDQWEAKVKIIGGTNTTSGAGSGVSISAKLDSDNVKPGENMDVTVTIRNGGAARTTYVVNAKGYDSWAALNSISDRIITLDPGASKDIKLNFAVNDSASAGEHTFVLETTTGAGKVESKEIAVNVEPSSAWSSFSSLFSGSNKSLVWVFAIVNLVLLVIIIVFWIRISRR